MTLRVRIGPVIVLVPIVAAMLAGVAGLMVPKVAHAAAGAACYGASCNGLDPDGLCTGDAITVVAMDVPDGMLELRYSPSCQANWGRYTPYFRHSTFLLSEKTGIYARVTVWNPGGPSYGLAHDPGIFYFTSSWSYMTDGTQMACTGVEVVQFGDHADTKSLGWVWGPCY